MRPRTWSDAWPTITPPLGFGGVGTEALTCGSFGTISSHGLINSDLTSVADTSTYRLGGRKT